MREERCYYVYILASTTGTLYVDQQSRRANGAAQVWGDRGFYEKYKVKKLLYYEEYDDVYMAITREKEIKKWRRDKKIALFKEMNPGWVDLSKNWFDD
ncbi:MAG: GIY-YIG nuclease family protein [Chloroflexi bacterium]|nr:GIY-YIG nuclease family protein [Chloroflexota bacterium]